MFQDKAQINLTLRGQGILLGKLCEMIHSEVTYFLLRAV